MEEFPKCESCGMPMRKWDDFGGGKAGNKYCTHCCDESGNLKSYDEVFTGMTQFAMKMMGVSESEAQTAAKENMAKMPAWKNVN